MRRREVIAIAGSAAAWPLAVRAQQATKLVIGLLSARSAASGEPMAAAFRQGLREAGYVEGQSLQIEYRWAEGHYEKLEALANDLVRSQVAVIGALSGTPAALAAKAATTAIPIVFGNGGDPIASGLVASLNRPEGNITGATFYSVELAGKRLGLLREVVQTATAFGFIANPSNPIEELETKDAEAAARALGIQLKVFKATNEREIDAAFATLFEQRVDAFVVGSDPLFLAYSRKLADLAKRHALPAIYYAREFPAAGGLMSYGSRPSDTYHQAGIYVGKILQGAKPTDLPIMRPTKFELVINLKTAKTLGREIPLHLQQIADEVIE